MNLFNDLTYEKLMETALGRVSSALDKREGSMIYNGLAPSMAELAQLYIGLDFVFYATYVATAPREYLIERAKDRGMSPHAASTAVFRADFNIQVAIGTRFSCSDLNFIVTERMEDAPGWSYKVECETPGAAANNYAGTLIPIEYVEELTSAELVELLIPGEDEEETETFRQRVLAAMQGQAFGGNIADYKAKVLDIDGVSAVKVYPAWNADVSPASLIPNHVVDVWVAQQMDSDISYPGVKTWITNVYNAAKNQKLMVGGSVKLVIMAAGNVAPTAELINTVQTIIDPTANAGEGRGLAPIGHNVLVAGVGETTVAINTTLTYKSGYSWDNVKERVKSIIDDYFDELADGWADVDSLVVRISQLEGRILSGCSTMIDDITGTTLNGTAANLTLDADNIPKRGAINGQTTD